MQALGPECDLEMQVHVGKREEQLWMCERLLLVLQSTVLNNSHLAAADTLINWKGPTAQNAAELFDLRGLG